MKLRRLSVPAQYTPEDAAIFRALELRTGPTFWQAHVNCYWWGDRRDAELMLNAAKTRCVFE